MSSEAFLKADKAMASSRPQKKLPSLLLSDLRAMVESQKKVVRGLKETSYQAERTYIEAEKVLQNLIFRMEQTEDTEGMGANCLECSSRIPEEYFLGATAVLCEECDTGL